MNETTPQIAQVMVSDLLQVTIPNWKKFNPRSDRVNFSWFRMENRFFEDQSIFYLNDQQKILYLFILCTASKGNTETFEIRTSYASALLRRDEKSVRNDFFFLSKLKLLEIMELDSPKPILDAGVTLPSLCRQNDVTLPSKWHTTRRNVTRRDVTKKNTLVGILTDYPQEFDQLWTDYGRRGDKKAAFKEYGKLGLQEEEKQTLASAIKNYVASNPDPKYRKHFCRFLQTDWVDTAKAPLMNGVHPKTQERLNVYERWKANKTEASQQGGTDESES